MNLSNESATRRLEALVRELDAIIDSSSDGLWICDAEGRVIRINPASERINNIRAEEVVGKRMDELLAAGFVDRSAALEALKEKRVVSLLQTNHNGRRLISTGTPVFDEAGEVIRVVVSERDITETERLQRQLEEQQAMEESYRDQMLQMQQLELRNQPIIARSPAFARVLRQALKVAAADSSVLITGESGTGKGLLADIIHQHSARADKPLIKLNCGAIPETLIESELFGYEKGAFTGARSSGKPGHLELANGGILFLDEIAELPLASQVKLLRFLEDGRITRLGGTRTVQVDVRIIAATHQDLQKMVDEGRFRFDLFYRLNVIPLNVPPLRERRECILPLVRHYLEHFGGRIGAQKRLTTAASDRLEAYDFPGNVRELMNICERLVVMSETNLIDVSDLPAVVLGKEAADDELNGDWPTQMGLEQIVASVERQVLRRACERYRSQARIAAALGVSQPTIARKLKKYGLSCG
ncbi:PAS domain S-box-containing protein/TyrR family helix-turn-helix protein [Geothermobacter ehrlichii]|uniref:HTH-type transcriptional regulatory protein TyrR n=1 Tax=Geothermobacter ehrlichii TaxID=213224 RepID=A0A5D3WJD7_9BACT|nr:sigma 54-interacting transcriptional regulator [Geothermobacter ehrlichii]TYO99043.1 PAS domain S-box-containing protein/TyrR family helix-turn-helix protein [Geothermobacter ehrlichii]